jgi:uncharacterized protein YcbK (DUF882 family)
MGNYELNKRNFIKIAMTLGISAGACPLSSLMLPESALASTPGVPLRLRNPHTDEHYEIDLFSGGAFNKNGLIVCNWIMRDWRQSKGNQIREIDPGIFAALYVIQRAFESDKFININSGYRSPETNAMLRARSIARKGRVTAEAPAVNSQHMQAKAVDFSIPGVSPLDATKLVLHLQSRTRIGGVGSYDTFTHMDTASKRKWGRGI